MRVGDILKLKLNPLFTVQPGQRLSDCVILMSDADLGSLPVLDQGQLVGLLTFREVINVLAQRQKELRRGPTPPVAELQVKHVMDPEPIVASPQMDVRELRSLMVHHHQRYLPVVEATRLRGVVSFHDLAKAVHEEQNFENRMLKTYIGDWPLDERTGSST
ncbi:CBS domain-containing protein [Paraburkholderia dipogonis]|uniref:CBS domain-containing protein n=1 Tax=Paraburkholderia dipogonis TaxID=1211383 RepID=UPI0038BC6572